MSSSLSDLIRRLWHGSGYQQPSDQCDPDTLSASVDLEDIINEYDEPTTSTSRRRSHFASALSFSTTSNGVVSGGLKSLSYYSLNARPKEDETTSFYSALQDGFSLDDYNLKFSFEANNREFSWSGEGYTKRDTMLPASEFEVYWSDLTYAIRSRSSASVNLFNDLQARFHSTLSNSASLLSSCPTRGGRRRSYDFQNADTTVVAAAEVDLDNSISSSSDKEHHHQHQHQQQQQQQQLITILQQINGSFKSSELTAVLGPSGAGKTSLLNFLSRRSEKGFTGSLNVNDDLNHKIQINAIPQDDHVPEYLTVRENLMFASQLKNTNPNQNHENNVRRVSYLLGLDECLDTRTKNISGGQQKRLAIAQELLSKPDILILDEPTSGLDSLTCLKTLSVLKDLVLASAKKLIDPIAIVLTIHQPQLEAFNLFDKVYVMASGGIVIYDGPPSKCIQFVETHSGLVLPSEDCNPASFLIDIASGEYGQEPIDALAKQVKVEFNLQRGARMKDSNTIKESHRHQLQPRPPPMMMTKSVSERVLTTEEVKDSPTKTKNSISDGLQAEFDMTEISPSQPASIESIEAPQAQQPNHTRKHIGKSISSSRLYLDSRLINGTSLHGGHFLLKTRVLTKRCWISLVRDRKQLLARILFHIFFPFFMAFLMGQEPGRANACPKFQSEYSLKRMVDTDEYINSQIQEELFLTFENVGTLFISIYSCISANIAAMTLVFSIDMKSSLKEHYNGWYSMNSYILARLFSNIPLDLILPTTTIALIYVTTGQNTNTGGQLQDTYRILITALALFISSCTGQLFGMIFGAIYVGHITTALFASQGATLPFVLLSGFVARTKNMTTLVRYLSMTSLYRHCLEIAFIARYGYNVCDCQSNQLNASQIEMTGVSDKLRSFINNWLSTQQDDGTTTTTPSSLSPLDKNDTSTNNDLFQMIAKQVSFYNTYGIEIKSCNNIIPYQLYDYGLTERDLPWSFLALIILFSALLLILLVTVKIVVNYRTSL